MEAASSMCACLLDFGGNYQEAVKGSTTEAEFLLRFCELECVGAGEGMSGGCPYHSIIPY